MDNKIIFITGASDGLGFEVAKMLLKKGYKVVGLSRTKPNNKEIEYISLDLADEGSIKTVAEKINQMKNGFIFLNCAGVMADEDSINYDEVKRVFEVNTMGPILLEQLIFNTVKSTGSDIINIISTSATRGDIDQPIYSSSKWGMLGFTKGLSVRLKSTSARAVSIIPGGFISKMPEKIGRAIANPKKWMPIEVVAGELVKIIETPKQAEISEVIINRK